MPEPLGQAKLDAIAEFVKEDYETRKSDRIDLEDQWKEVDRQISMRPLPRDKQSGEAQDWFPALELPLQYNALEVIAADARRLKFPRGTEWFSAMADISDKYLERWDDRRLRKPLVGGEPAPIKLDQETANAVVKATLDHYHRLHDFRSAIDLFDAEMIKYGTGCVRIAPVELAAFRTDFRGVVDRDTTGPAVIPCAIRHTYLESGAALLHEGLCIAPSIIRYAEQLLAEIKRAAKTGTADRGWLEGQIAELTPEKSEDKRGFIRILHFAGDLLVPHGDGSTFLPSTLATVAIGANGPKVIRLQERPLDRYVIGHYLRHDPLSAYGVSPLMKGQPLQEAATLAYNELLAVAALSARPPVAYDRHDPELQAMGGPQIFPGAMWGTDEPSRIVPQQIGDINGMTTVYFGLVKQYEDLTGVTDPRRGAQVKSHTSATGTTIEAERGVARTDDFVSAVEFGAIRSILYAEYRIAQKTLGEGTPIPISAAGLEGYVTLGAADLADDASFFVHGSEGVIEERNKLQQFITATQAALQLLAAAAQTAAMGGAPPPTIDFEAMITEVYQRAGIQNVSRFIKPIPASTPPGAGVPGAAPGVPAGQASPLSPGPGAGGGANGLSV